MSTVRERSVPREAARRRPATPAGSPRGPGGAGRGTPWPYLLIAPAVLGMLYLLLYPLGRALLISVQDFRLRQLILGDAEFVGLRNYRTLLGDPEFWEVVRRTFVFMAVCVLAIMVLSTLVALMTERLGRVARTVVLSSLVLVWAVPVVAATTVFQWLFHSEFGIVNETLTGLGLDSYEGYTWFAHGGTAFAIVVVLIVWQSVPFAAITLYSALVTVPAELYESARMDGAGGTRVFRSVTFPLIRPIFMLVLSLEVIWTFKAFVQIWVMTRGGPGEATTILPVYAVQTALSGQRYDLGSAASMLTVLLMSGVLVLYFRQLFRQEGEQL
ncbi:sugar ABC transporter permease [Streptomyces parvulus]|uniref:Sugar ABC transporter permease n=1 Tax=Streptomyces parvulus TaxID=146923 RepID=A0ABV5DD02_9ACTN|nr:MULTISPECIES: sugar ABC transporter permease [Streptomyces]MCC9156150.1 sugar ABC transporter permease [Streptomyces parvulus]MCE7689538.1 sugar ABC transporter permease [Streptomyces parvulus]WHM28924.1 sugar ABC transporter permease [Streptomyces sp. BPPL-273]WML84196.1 sugar ABC transporter permease [Streptomyces sp. VNUA74]